jgi:invasion protein IalB
MIHRMKHRAGAALIALSIGLVAPSLVLAQTSTNRVAAMTDWSVFAEDTPTKACWSVSQPKETLNTRDGKPAVVSRGQIALLVSYWPNTPGQVSFVGGYPFAPQSTVELDVGGTKFTLYTQNETAWAASAEDDAKLITAMKAGANAVVTGRSARGTVTKDTFSLLGFTAAVDAAASRCK